MKFIPTFSDHLIRYVFALEKSYKKSVIDIGCNSGFGTSILSYGASDVTGVDFNDKNLFRASIGKYFCKVDFIKADLEKEFPKGKWDVAVSFELIEHIDNTNFLLKNIFENLSENGILIFSVPHMVANREHKVLFDENKIKEVIGKYGKIEEFYIQDKKVFSNKTLYKNLKVYVGIARKNSI